jgi:hypothetical protein
MTAQLTQIAAREHLADLRRDAVRSRVRPAQSKSAIARAARWAPPLLTRRPSWRRSSSSAMAAAISEGPSRS